MWVLTRFGSLVANILKMIVSLHHNVGILVSVLILKVLLTGSRPAVIQGKPGCEDLHKFGFVDTFTRDVNGVRAIDFNPRYCMTLHG
jgi:hypothetical protein